MCGMHVHTKQVSKGPDVFHICGEKYKALVTSFCNKFRMAIVGEFLLFTTLTKLKKIVGKNVFVMSKTVCLIDLIHALVMSDYFYYFACGVRSERNV